MSESRPRMRFPVVFVPAARRSAPRTRVKMKTAEPSGQDLRPGGALAWCTFTWKGRVLHHLRHQLISAVTFVTFYFPHSDLGEGDTMGSFCAEQSHDRHIASYVHAGRNLQLQDVIHTHALLLYVGLMSRTDEFCTQNTNTTRSVFLFTSCD